MRAPCQLLPPGPSPLAPSAPSQLACRPTFVAIAAARRQVAALLADACNELPTSAHMRLLRDNPVLAAAVVGDAPGAAAVAALRDAIDAAGCDSSAVDAVAIERTRLLRGIRPGQGLPPACESVYRADPAPPLEEAATGRLWAALRARYGRAGFGPNGNLPPDFIGNELAYIAFLAAGEMHAWERGDHGAALAFAREQLAFLDDHIGCWIGPLVERVRGEAAGGFWPAVLALTQAHLRQEREYLRELLHRGAEERDTPVSPRSS